MPPTSSEELRRVGPAHTIGDAVAFLPTEGILFTGDQCVNRRSGNNVGDRDADHRHWVQVLNDLARWDVKTKEIDLSRHGDFAADEQQNQSAIRAVFRKAPQ